MVMVSPLARALSPVTPILVPPLTFPSTVFCSFFVALLLFILCFPLFFRVLVFGSFPLRGRLCHARMTTSLPHSSTIHRHLTFNFHDHCMYYHLNHVHPITSFTYMSCTSSEVSYCFIHAPVPWPTELRFFRASIQGKLQFDIALETPMKVVGRDNLLWSTAAAVSKWKRARAAHQDKHRF